MNKAIIFPYLVTLAEDNLIVSGHITVADAQRNAVQLSNDLRVDIRVFENGNHIITARHGIIYGSDRL